MTTAMASGDSARRRPRRWRRWVLPVSLILLVCALMIAGLCAALYRVQDAIVAGHCQSSLRWIGMAAKMYANDNGGQYPPGFTELMLTQEITPAVFVCANSPETAATAPTTQQAAALLTPDGGHVSFVYVGDGLTAPSVLPDHVIAYEKPGHHRGGTNVLFGDGHVDLLDPARNATDAARLSNLQADTAAGVRPIKLRP